MSNKNVRHAEKDRSHSTCAFADRVCHSVLERYREETVGVEPAFSGQTVIAGMVAYDQSKNEMTCVSFGVGTKFRRYTDDKILAKQRYCELIGVSKPSTTVIVGTLNAASSTDSGNVPMGRSPTDTASSYKGKDDSGLSDMHAEVLAKKGFVLWLRENMHQLSNLTFHFYTSTAPCGNACIRKWGKGGIGQAFADLPDTQWPDLASKRQKFHYFAKKEGQGALLEKGRAVVPVADTMATEDDKINQHDDIYGNGRLWIAGGQTTPLTCSDKILKWQICGWQGSELPRTIRISTLTCGRKFSEVHINRALWERFVQPNKKQRKEPAPEELTSFKKARPKEEDEVTPQTVEATAEPTLSVVRTETTNAPVGEEEIDCSIQCLVTKLKTDESVYNGESAANFTDNRCFVYYKSQIRGYTELLDGSTGKVIQRCGVKIVESSLSIKDADRSVDDCVSLLVSSKPRSDARNGVENTTFSLYYARKSKFYKYFGQGHGN